MRFDQIIGAEIATDGRSVNKVNRGGQAVGAAAGALLFGPAGLLLGGFSGSRRVEETIKRVSLNLYISDLKAPLIVIRTLDSWTGFKADGFVVKAAKQQAQQLFAVVQAIIADARLSPAPAPAPVTPPDQDSVRMRTEAAKAAADRRAAEARVGELRERIERKRLARERRWKLEPEA